jgi:hypothetical protein
MITLKEQPGAHPTLRFLVGEKRVRPVQIAVFEDATSQKVVAHKQSLADKVTVFHVLGFGRTAERAKAMAAAKVGPDFFYLPDMGSCARFGEGNQVAA